MHCPWEHIAYWICTLIPIYIKKTPLRASCNEFTRTPMEAPLDRLHVRYGVMHDISLTSWKTPNVRIIRLQATAFVCGHCLCLLCRTNCSQTWGNIWCTGVEESKKQRISLTSLHKKYFNQSHSRFHYRVVRGTCVSKMLSIKRSHLNSNKCSELQPEKHVNDNETLCSYLTENTTSP
jgi:hypothetical protein